MFPNYTIWLLLLFAAQFALARQDAWTDPPFSVSEATMANAVSCPRGIQGKPGGIVFLIHGTGLLAVEAWGHGPYNLILPDIDPGYDVCWVDLPGRSLGNAATSAEYVAYGIKQLARVSSTGKVFVIGHSQGAGLDTPWALNFFPSTRQYVAGFISISGDHYGSILGNPICLALDIAEGHCAESLFQQDLSSQFISAQNLDGGKALVPTTAISTLEDEIIVPEPLYPKLPGASNILIQSPDACGPLHIIDHFFVPFDSAVFGMALDALANEGIANPNRFDKAYCIGFKDNTLFDLRNAAADVETVITDIVNMAITPSPYVSTQEPPLPQYVCDRYPWAGYYCAAGPLF